MLKMGYIKGKELQEHLKVSSVTIWRWRKEGLPFKKLGPQSIRFDLEEVMKWLEKRGESTNDSSN